MRTTSNYLVTRAQHVLMGCLHLASHVRVNRIKNAYQVSALYLLNDSPFIVGLVAGAVVGSVGFVSVAGVIAFKWFAKRGLLKTKVIRITPDSNCSPNLEQAKIAHFSEPNIPIEQEII